MAKRLITKYKPAWIEGASDQSLVDMIADLMTSCNDHVSAIRFRDNESATERIITVEDLDATDGTDKFWLKFVVEGNDIDTCWYVSNDYDTTNPGEETWFCIAKQRRYGRAARAGDFYAVNRYEAVVTEKQDIIVYGSHAEENVVDGSITRKNESRQPIFVITRFTKIVDDELQSALGIIYFGSNSGNNTSSSGTLHINSITTKGAGNAYVWLSPNGGSGLIFPDSDLSSLKNNYFILGPNLGASWYAGTLGTVNWNVKRPIYTNAPTEQPCLTILGLLYTHDAPYIATTTRMIELSRTNYTDGLYLFSGHKYYVTYGLAFLDE